MFKYLHISQPSGTDHRLKHVLVHAYVRARLLFALVRSLSEGIQGEVEERTIGFDTSYNHVFAPTYLFILNFFYAFICMR